MFRLILLAIICLSFIAGASATSRCPNSNVTEMDIDAILNAINTVRTNVRNGMHRNGESRDFLPPAQSMPNLTWDCSLEMNAEKVLENSCSGGQTPPSGITPVFVSLIGNERPIVEIINTHLENAEFNSLTRIEDDRVIYNNETTLGEFATMIREKTTKIGCSKVFCQFFAGVFLHVYSCVADQPPIKVGETIYEVLKTTTTTTTTTTTSASAAELPQGANVQCMSNTGMTDTLRSQFLDMHNYRRGLLAQGTIARKNGNFYPRAANMARMNYDCGLEAEALTHVKQCPSSKSANNNAGENFLRISTSGLNSWSDGVKKVVTSWWKVVRTSSRGVGVNAVTFRQHHVGTEVESWSQMAWARTTRLGCSIAKCFGDYVAVCRYMERGNVVGQQVYIRGPPCSQCSNGCHGSGLCN